MVVRSRTIGTQSIYRETEVQTEVWSPPYKVADGTNPEVLSIVQICTSKGIPVTEAEVATIERMRQKRLLESKLPPPTDEFCMHLREALVDAQEFEEWRQREELIKDLQAKRLELVKAALEERELAKEEFNKAKIERVRSMCIEWRDRGLDEIQQRRLKVVRQTNRDRKKLQDKLYPPDKSLVHQHYDTASKLFGPYTRDGHVPDTRTAKINVDPSDLQTYAGLTRLETELQRTKPQLFRTNLPELEYSALTKSKASRRQFNRIGTALKATLETLKAHNASSSHNHLGDETLGTGVGLSTLHQGDHGDLTMGVEFGTLKRGGLKTMNAEDNTSTTDSATLNNASTNAASGLSRAHHLAEDEAECQAILLLQRLIRGRARQNIMHEGKEKRLALIDELRAAEKLAKAAVVSSNPNSAKSKEIEAERIELTEAAAASSLLEAVGGRIISEALDGLSKELKRFEEARRVAAMAKLAERERRARQAGEAGRRQAEEVIRQREDELFRQVMGANFATVDSYLENVLTSTIERKALAEALTEAKLRAEVINEVVDELEEKDVDPHTAVRELVSSFLLPQVKREDVKRKVAREQVRFAIAAKAAAQLALQQTVKTLSAVNVETEQEAQ